MHPACHVTYDFGEASINNIRNKPELIGILGAVGYHILLAEKRKFLAKEITLTKLIRLAV
jgi:hypothetical protein